MRRQRRAGIGELESEVASGSGRGGEAAISWMVLLKLGVRNGTREEGRIT